MAIKKKILFITPFAPSNIGAAMKFTKKTIEELANSYYVDLIYFKAEGESDYIPENNNIKVIESFKVDNKGRFLSVFQRPWLYPIFSVRYKKELAKRLRSFAKKKEYDLVFLDHSQSFIYGSIFKDVPKILMSHDVIYQRVSRSSGKLSAMWCKRTEQRMMKQDNASIFTFSTKDQSILKETYGLDSFVTSGSVDELVYDTSCTEISDNCVFFGQWVRKDNSDGLDWFLDNVYPKVSSHYNYKIIGRGLSDEIKEKISKLNDVEYLGFVDNPYPIIANARAVISPLFTGAGVKFKVLEAMACGTPVIGSDISFEGIPANYAYFMRRAETVEDYINLIDSVDLDIEHRMKERTVFLNSYVKSQLVEHIKQIIG